ncbi:hypothetical protein L6164_018315 [Bauhinia variegata]|uniref:Uncharacterized protein n=1 Tax=Bauhinia variegata TaxID=167791 RepID=A0ACB9NAM8_BAUVA|nr:hypothetical protein L6164_018315 [Bauhinia variegata]
MALFRNLLSQRFQSLLTPQNPLYACQIVHSNAPHCHQFPPFINRTFTSSPQIEDPSEPNPERKKNKTPLHVLFKQAVGLSEKTENSETESEGEAENNELKRKLKQLEQEVRSLKAKSKEEGDAKRKKPKKPEQKSLYDAFTHQSSSAGKLREVKLKEPIVLKELSPDMELFVEHLYKRGYFKDANFAKDKKFNLSLFETRYAREFIKRAAESFGRDNQEIAKWVSGKDLKEVAMFGCPSVYKSSVFVAKRLRKFFEIQENTVCSKCALKPSCKYRNQTVWKTDTNNLDLGLTMKLITSYSLEESMDPRLVVPHKIRECISRLLKKVLKLSPTT